jgi:subtilisin
VQLVPLDGGHRDGLAVLCPKPSGKKGAGVRIAIIDTGTDEAEGLNIARGVNMTGVEPNDRWSDNGSGHGTHVAGIVSRVVPGAELHIYRVFAAADGSAGEIAISKAIRDAVDNGCDIINLSLGQDTEPLAISRQTRRARQLGVVCVAAAGNDGMGPVVYPARSSHMLAVSACGVLGSWPTGASTGNHVADDPEPINKIFFAAFSNCGDAMDFIAPGVGTISWVSRAERGVMDGTSMACPVVTALIAAMLAEEPALLAAERDQQRSDDIIKLAFSKAKRIGFGESFEGSGFIGAVS